MLQNHLNLPIRLCKIENERLDRFRERCLRESVQEVDNIGRLKPDRDRGIQAVAGQSVFMQVGGTRKRLGDGGQKVLRLRCQRGETLQGNGTLQRIDPKGTVRMIRFQ